MVLFLPQNAWLKCFHFNPLCSRAKGKRLFYRLLGFGNILLRKGMWRVGFTRRFRQKFYFKRDISPAGCCRALVLILLKKEILKPSRHNWKIAHRRATKIPSERHKQETGSRHFKGVPGRHSPCYLPSNILSSLWYYLGLRNICLLLGAFSPFKASMSRHPHMTRLTAWDIEVLFFSSFRYDHPPKKVKNSLCLHYDRGDGSHSFYRLSEFFLPFADREECGDWKEFFQDLWGAWIQKTQVCPSFLVKKSPWMKKLLSKDFTTLVAISNVVSVSGSLRSYFAAMLAGISTITRSPTWVPGMGEQLATPMLLKKTIWQKVKNAQLAAKKHL